MKSLDVVVEEGGPRVEAKRRGGDPLPRATRRAKSRERAGNRVFGCVAASWTKSQAATQPKTRGDAQQAREGSRALGSGSVDRRRDALRVCQQRGQVVLDKARPAHGRLLAKRWRQARRSPHHP